MNSIKIKLDTPYKLERFLSFVDQCNGDVYARSVHGARTVNAKSTIGLMSLGRNAPILIEFENSEDLQKYYNAGGTEE